ncbi:MAG: hypothetical protein DME97_17710 [Verrucomicrobia bacterium]|nr:MAG: hypothetical protein DME97_17710 [Verrucomicrobiota bacterium]
MTLKPDTYSLYARTLPALISATPLFVLWYFVRRDAEWRGLLTFVFSLRFLGAISLSAVFLYFYSHFLRYTSKWFERRYFTSRRGFPTTYFMLFHDTTYSKDYKAKFRARVKAICKLDLLDEADEHSQPLEAKNRLNECINHIRLKVGPGKLVLKHNIWYGFTRNLLGGAIYSSLFCCVNILLGLMVLKSDPLVIASAILLVIYSTLLMFHRALLFQNAEAYARQLISEFMAVGNVRSPK